MGKTRINPRRKNKVNAYGEQQSREYWNSKKSLKQLAEESADKEIDRYKRLRIKLVVPGFKNN